MVEAQRGSLMPILSINETRNRHAGLYAFENSRPKKSEHAPRGPTAVKDCLLFSLLPECKANANGGNVFPQQLHSVISD